MSIKPRRIYLDYASTTPVDKRVLEAMTPFLEENFGNPDSIHKEGVLAKEALKGARAAVAQFFGCKPHEVIFTSGGTEANNIAILGAAAALEKSGANLKKTHAIVSSIEHASVLEPFRELERRGISVTYLPVKEDGLIDLSEFKKSLRPETFLVSIGYANNEIGVIQPITKIGKLTRGFRYQRPTTSNLRPTTMKNRRPIFHVDACQALNYLPVKVESLGADLVSVDGSKSYGPKGVGALCVRRGVPIEKISFGGEQEFSLRPGIVPVYLAVGLAKALEICEATREKESRRLQKLQDHLHSQILENLRMKIPTVVNGSMEKRLPNNINVSLPGVDTELLTLKFDAAGFAVSTKSACLAGERISYVVKALGRSDEEAASALRVTLGRATTLSDVKKFIKALQIYLL